MRFTRRQKENLGKTLLDLCKLTFAGLVIGNLFEQEKFNVWIFSIGFGLFVLLFVLGVIADKGGAQG